MSEIIYVQVGDKKRKATPEEISQFEKDHAEQLEREKLFEAAEKEKAEKKESATNKLKALGLTDSEVEALLG
jgi:hypothetical protein